MTDPTPAAARASELPNESKGDGETWEDYAHRLESRIKRQRDHIKSLTALRVPGNIKARKRIAALERLIGKQALRLALQDEGLRALNGRPPRERDTA